MQKISSHISRAHRVPVGRFCPPAQAIQILFHISLRPTCSLYGAIHLLLGWRNSVVHTLSPVHFPTRGTHVPIKYSGFRDTG